jgi:hypothetical protein
MKKKKSFSKLYLYGAIGCIAVIAIVGYIYCFSSFSKSSKTEYVYIDSDDHPGRLSLGGGNGVKAEPPSPFRGCGLLLLRERC